jgi:DNA-binding MarR family transcriptional regulator
MVAANAPRLDLFAGRARGGMTRSMKSPAGGQQPLLGGGDQSAAAIASADDALLKLETFLPYQLNVVASLVSLALSRVYSRRYGIGVPEWRVLVTLGQYGVMTGKAIGAHTHMHKTKVSRAVAVLEKRKLLLRRTNRADMRESFLSLTPAGRAMYEELAPHALDFAHRLTEILAPGDRDAFNRALKQLTERSAELVAEVAGQIDPMEDA